MTIVIMTIIAIAVTIMMIIKIIPCRKFVIR